MGNGHEPSFLVISKGTIVWVILQALDLHVYGKPELSRL